MSQDQNQQPIEDGESIKRLFSIRELIDVLDLAYPSVHQNPNILFMEGDPSLEQDLFRLLAMFETGLSLQCLSIVLKCSESVILESMERAISTGQVSDGYETIYEGKNPALYYGEIAGQKEIMQLERMH